MSTTTFVWKGTTPQGEPMAGEYEAAAKPEVAAYLRKRKIAVRSIRPKAKDIKFNYGPKKGVKVKDMSVFTRQFSTMINAGLPIVQCLDILSQQTENDQLLDGGFAALPNIRNRQRSVELSETRHR